MSYEMIFAVGSLVFAIIAAIYVLRTILRTYCWRHTWVLDLEQNGVGVYHCVKCGQEKVAYANIGKVANSEE